MRLPREILDGHDGLAQLLDVLGAGEGLIRFVGGAVRDGLLRHRVADIDCATLLLPDAVMARLRAAQIKVVPTGIEHGTVTAVLPSGPVEVTTLRRDVSTDGRRATIAYSDDWQEDASRRDFTINALYADPLTLEITDFFGGLADLEAHRVRFIGDPLTRIAEDHLRILRFFRFHARFAAGAPDPSALAACIARANDLMALSRERIAAELVHLLNLPDPGLTVALMEREGIFRPVIPEVTADGVIRLRATITSEVESGIQPDPIRRLAALLPPLPMLAEQVAQRLKMSNANRKRMMVAAGWSDMAPNDPRAIAWSIGTEGAVDRYLITGGQSALAAVALLNTWERPVFPLSGKDIIAHGIRPGPEVARLLQAVERQWVVEGFPPQARLDEMMRDAVGPSEL
jgi:poly(A) polymerase